MTVINANPEILVYENDTTTYLGSIDDLIYGKQTDIDNAIGNGQIKVPAGAANTDLITRGRILVVKVETFMYGYWATYYPIIIIVKKIQTETRSKQTILNVTGTNMLSELTYRSIGQNIISDGLTPPGLADNDILQALAYAPPNWLVGEAGSSTGSYIVGAGETVFDTLKHIAEQSGDHFATNPVPGLLRYLSWSSDPAVDLYTGITLTLPDNPMSADADPSTAVILNLKEHQGEHEQITRIYAYGAGLGDAALKITAAEGHVAVPPGITVHWASSLLIHSDSEAAGAPRIERYLDFSNIQPGDTNADTETVAAIALFNAAVNYLLSIQEQPKLYTIKCTSPTTFIPMYMVDIDYTIRRGAEIIYSVQETVFIHEVTREIGRDGIVYSTLKCGTTEHRHKPTDARAITSKIKQMDTALKHATAPAAGTAVAITQHHDLLGLEDDDHPLYLREDGTRPLSNNLAVASGKTIDGVDISAHAANANSHHNWPLQETDIPVEIPRFPDLHDPVTVAAGSDPALTLVDQQLHLNDVTTQAEFNSLVNQDLRTAASPTFSDLFLTSGLLLTDRDSGALYRLFVKYGKVWLEEVTT